MLCIPGAGSRNPSNYRPEMAMAAVLALLAGLATWAVVRLRRHTSAQTHSMRRGLLWGVPLVLIVGPAIFAPLVLLMNSISLD
jgi:H+/Cl- antiporter ClcA